MDLEAPKNVKDGYAGNIFSGYFKPPATARYRFYISCDDGCQLYLGNKSLDPTSTKSIYNSTSWAYYRQYITPDWKRRTDWISLTKDDFLYIEVRHYQVG